ncbi:hypothetical protein QOZ80_2AG0104860 [Eleusine coracana subsp. coracana]|nr:hypothetical protein QOZ80_2AG0104860 [Eleusine coracana subsp. coracana]
MSVPGDATRDWLSDLPNDILHRILRFLDARQAVGVLSLVSRRFRYLWATMPFITLRSPNRKGSEKFGNLLLLRDGRVSLHTFCLHSWCSEHFNYEQRWLHHAMSRGLCVLELNLNSINRYFQLPECVFSCAALEELKLFSTGIREAIAPRSVCLPRLKKLHLDVVQFMNSSVANMHRSGCPALQDLSLSRSILGSFKISSKTLKVLSITDCSYKELHVSAPHVASLRLTVSGKVQLDGMSFLVKAWVYVCDDAVQHLARGGYDLAAALCNAQQLELFRFNLFVEDIMENSAHDGLSFNKLKNLYIGEWLVTDFYGLLTFFLQRAPNLVTLTLDQCKLYKRHGNIPRHVTREKKPIVDVKLISALTRLLRRLEDSFIQHGHHLRDVLLLEGIWIPGPIYNSIDSGKCYFDGGDGEARPNHASNLDRLSVLADDLLHRILRFLDARQSVHLSLLSRRWRHLWASSPFITMNTSSCFESFGNSLLLLRDPTPLHAFCLYSTSACHFAFQRKWLRHATSRGLRVLAVTLRSGHHFQLPECAFNCATLEEIDLLSIGHKELIAPKSICLPRLKKLHLENVQTEPSTVEKLSSALNCAKYLELFRFDQLFQKDVVQKSGTESLSFSNFKSLHIGEWLVADFDKLLAYFIQCAPNLAHLTLDQRKLYDRHNENLPTQASREKKPSDKLKQAPALPRNLETLQIRISKGDDIEEVRQMRALLKEKTKPKETEVEWF